MGDVVGDALGDALGDAVVGDALGDADGDLLGDVLGDCVAPGLVGEEVGAALGDTLGDAVVGDALGDALGDTLGDALGASVPMATSTLTIGLNAKPCAAYSATPLPKNGMRRSTSVAPSESRVCTITAACSSTPRCQALAGVSAAAYTPPPTWAAATTMFAPTAAPSVPCVAASAGACRPLVATSSDTSVCAAAAALCSLNSRTATEKASVVPATSAPAVTEARNRYFFASALSRYTASFCLNAPSCVGSSCACCHAHSAAPAGLCVGTGPDPASSSTDARRTSLMSKTQSPFVSPNKRPTATSPEQHVPSSASERRQRAKRSGPLRRDSSRLLPPRET